MPFVPKIDKSIGVRDIITGSNYTIRSYTQLHLQECITIDTTLFIEGRLYID